MRFVVVACIVASSSVAVAAPPGAERILGWQGEITFSDGYPPKTSSRTTSCAHGKACSQVDTSEQSSKLTATLTARKATTATVTFHDRLATKTVTTFSEQCPTSGSMLRKPPPVYKDAKWEDTGVVTLGGSATAEASVRVEILSTTKARLEFTIPQIAGKQQLVETKSRTGGCHPSPNVPAKPYPETDVHSMRYEIRHELAIAWPKDLAQLELVGKGTQGTRDFTWKLKPVITKSDLVADAGPDVRVPWGKRVTLDGSKSKPRGKLTYRWQPVGVACGNDSDLKAMKPLSGAKLAFQPLCSITMQLVVSDGTDEATDEVVVTVDRRSGKDWTLPEIPKSKPNWKYKPPRERYWPMPMIGDDGDTLEFRGHLRWGLNVCAKDQQGPEWGLLHPHPTSSGGSWSTSGGYESAIMKGGPFDGWHYVKQVTYVIDREGIFNQYAHPDGPKPDGATENYATQNQHLVPHDGKQMPAYEAWKQALVDHETEGKAGNPKIGHTKLIRDALKDPANDPRRAIEAIASSDRNNFILRVDDALNGADKRLRDASKKLDEDKSPDAYTFRGKFFYWHKTKGWYEIVDKL